MHVERAGRGAVDIPKPAWFGQLDRLAVDSAGGRVAMMGWNAGSYDSVGVAVAPLAGGAPVLWTADAAEGADVQWLRDGAMLFSVRDTPESAVLYRVAGPGRMTRVGRVARPSANTSVSDDLKRISVVERNYHGRCVQQPGGGGEAVGRYGGTAVRRYGGTAVRRYGGTGVVCGFLGAL